MPEKEEYEDKYYVGFYFDVEFTASNKVADDPPIKTVQFQEVSGLSAQIGTMELQEGGLNTFSHRLPNPVKYGNLVLKRAVVKEESLFKWVKNAIEDFTFTPKDITVKLIGHDKQPIKQWYFSFAIPVKWSVSNLNSMSNALVIETLELSYQSFRHNEKAKSSS